MRIDQRENIHLKQTCGACPEQYDAVLVPNGEVVGYLRLRHGYFSVTCPHVEGKLVYEAYPDGDGYFGDSERDEYLQKAVDAIKAWLEKKNYAAICRQAVKEIEEDEMIMGDDL